MGYGDRTMTPEEQVVLRTSAVEATIMGEKKRQVAQRFGITRQTLHNWVLKHRRGGTAALAGRQPGRTRRRILQPSQEALVVDTILQHSPAIVNQRYTRWTKKAIASFVEQEFGIRFSPWQVDSHLRRWGFVSHKVVRRAFLDTPGRNQETLAERTRT